jgi:hypothetical protein
VVAYGESSPGKAVTNYTGGQPDAPVTLQVGLIEREMPMCRRPDLDREGTVGSRIDIDGLTEPELVDLNNRIVERLRFLRQARAHSRLI